MEAAELKTEWQSACGSVRLYCADCLDVLPHLRASGVSVVISDPPYGIGYNRGAEPQSKHRFANRGQLDVIVGDSEPFDPGPLLQWPFILWGANNYASRLPDLPGWICWDKVVQNGLKGLRIAECEFAASNCVRRARVFRHLWSGAYRASERGVYVHPTQKPVALMRFCLTLPGVPSGCVLDPYMGSGSTGIACVYERRPFIGIEIRRKHFDVAVERIARAMGAGTLFPPAHAQPDLQFDGDADV